MQSNRLVLWITGVLAGALIMTMVPASAHHGSSTRALRNRITNLEIAVFECLYATPMNQYFGYVYEDEPTGEEFLTNAVDLSEEIDQFTMEMATIDERCLGASRQKFTVETPSTAQHRR